MQIDLRGITKQFPGVLANDNIQLTFESGKIVGILGENGAGKSTLMKILAGYFRPDSGEIWLGGQRVEYYGVQAAIASGVGMLQQDPLDIAAFTVLENFTYGGRPQSRRAARDHLLKLCQRSGFTLDPDAYIVSIAQRQQLEIVRLLALDVKVLILDEPTTGISAEQKNQLFNTLRELAQNESMTILLVSHKLEDVITLCDEVAVLRAGRVVGTLPMPATSQQLVELMFGGQVEHYQHARFQPAGKAEVLVLDKITLNGGRVTVGGFTLRLRAGEIVGLAGLEGSGQELVLRAAVGLVRPQRGEIYINGQRLDGASYIEFTQQGVAFAPAGRLEEGLVAGLTITEHIALTTERGLFIDWKQAAARTQARIDHYQIRGTPTNRIETLSGGNQQRVLMALMPEQPTALILEQPTRGLDVDSARWIWQQLLARRDTGAAILFSSAELDEIMEYSDRIIVFYAGQAFEVSDPSATTLEDLGYLIGGKVKS